MIGKAGAAEVLPDNPGSPGGHVFSRGYRGSRCIWFFGSGAGIPEISMLLSDLRLSD
jgi:hypothetical protein